MVPACMSNCEGMEKGLSINLLKFVSASLVSRESMLDAMSMVFGENNCVLAQLARAKAASPPKYTLINAPDLVRDSDCPMITKMENLCCEGTGNKGGIRAIT